MSKIKYLVIPELHALGECRVKTSTRPVNARNDQSLHGPQLIPPVLSRRS
ncbi:MAG: hypothetical protein AB2693_35150 [Candidatus Thiodiazotropha sp.]